MVFYSYFKKNSFFYTEITSNNAIAILGSSFIGAMAFAFSDSFWFNAVEAEVYAMAMLFIALMVWLALRWEERYASATRKSLAYSY